MHAASGTSSIIPQTIVILVDYVFMSSKHLLSRYIGGIKFREKSGLHPPTIAKVQFSIFNYETGQHGPSNCQNRANFAPGVVLKVVFYFVRIKNIQFYTKKFISNSFEVKKL